MGGIGKSYLTYDNVNLHNILLLLLLREVKAQAAVGASCFFFGKMEQYGGGIYLLSMP